MKNASIIRVLTLLCFLMGAMLAQAADAVRPRVGLVLGGGGARGAAHIGVLEVLEKLRVPVDCVVGTSMGALVSGAFAAGVAPAEMRAELAKADWNDMFQDNPPYSEINYRNKGISRRFMPGSETGVSRKGVEYQAGVVAGQKIKLFFNRLVHSDLGERNIEALPLPLAIIATDIGNGDRVVIRDGSLSKAMRASMSVPGLMAPVDHAGRKLVDGGLVDNVPITEARELCKADIVIAVNVGSPLLKAEDVGSLLTVSVQMVNILTEQNVTRSLAMLKPSDIYIKPDLEGITAGDFQKSSETADRGKAATEALGERLKSLSVSAEHYAEWAKSIAFVRSAPPTIHGIEIAGLKTVNPAAVQRHLRVKAGDQMEDVALNKDMLRIYGDGWYETVDYSVLTARDRNILRVTPVEKIWGPDYLRFGINLDTNFSEDSSYTLRAAYDRTWLNTLGGQVLVGAEIGRKNMFGVDYYQPLEESQRYFMEASMSYGKERFSAYQNGRKQAEYNKTLGSASVGVGMNVGLLGQLRVGYKQNWVESSLETGVATGSIPQGAKESYGGQYAGIDFDQMDRLYFPTSGWASRLGYFNAPGEGYSKVNAELRGAYSFNDYVLSSKLSYQGSPRGQLPSYDAGSLGGFLNLSGFAPNQLNGDDIRFGSLRIEKIIGRLPMGLRGDMRAGFALEAGKIGVPYTETQRTGWLRSKAVYVGGETPLGPVYLGYGYSDSGASNFYLFIGTP